jgi:hypothetical protein
MAAPWEIETDTEAPPWDEAPPWAQAAPVQPPEPAFDPEALALINRANLVDPRTGLKRESGMESGTEMLTALASDPKQIPGFVAGAAMLPFQMVGKPLRAVAEDIGTMVSGHPEYGGNVSEFFNRTSPEESSIPMPYQETLADVSKTAPVAATASKIAGGLVESAPMMVAGMPAGTLGKLVALGFTADMIRNAGPAGTALGEEMGKPAEQRDMDKITSAIAELTTSGVLAPLMASHALKRAKAAEFQGPLASVAEQPVISPAMERAQVVKDMTGPEFSKAFPKGMNPENWELGETATAADVTTFKKHLADVESALSTQKEKAKAGTLKPEEMQGLMDLSIKRQYFSEAIQAAPKEVGGEDRVFRGAEEREAARASRAPASSTVPASDLFPELKGKAPTLERVRRAITEAEKVYDQTATDAQQIDVPSDSPLHVAADVAMKRLERLRTLGGRLEQESLSKAKQPAPPAAETGKEIASDWTSATEDVPAKPATASLVNPPDVELEAASGIPIPKFANRKMSPLDRVTSSHSGKLQKSFDESRRAQREIKADVPNERRQNAISIWREAKGDLSTLQGWVAAAKGKLFKRAAIDAQTLTPKEIAVATKVGAAFDALHTRGTTFDVLRSHRDSYVPHVWDVAQPGTGFGTGMLKQRFRFSKARTFNTFFDGDQAGFKPKTLAIGKLLPAYIHEMNKVIADRQAVRDIVAGTNKDGSPMAIPRGTSKVVEGDEGKAVLVQPRGLRDVDTSDYRVMSDQPALSNWTWASKDTAGKPVFIKADLALHPDAYRRINAMIGQSSLRSWYHDPVTGTGQIPRAIVRGLDTAQSAMKREMFGLLAPFHQVQEGTHGIGHIVNPFSHIPKVDLRDPAQLDAANHGLMMLPDRASARVYLEGVGTKSSLLSQGIRKLGRAGEAVSDVIDGYQDYLFHQYIPGLKFKTYQAILERNMKLYVAEFKSGEMTPDDVKITSAEQANAAYGHLNYALLDRNPTIQHLIQLSTLAPDFLEARVRFTGQAVKGLSSKVGHEQFKAIAILAAVQASSAYIISNVTGGQYDPHHPFEVIHNGRRYAMRSVPEDIFSLLKDTRQFIYARVNPLTVKGGIQLATGLNYRGEKVDTLDTLTELLAGYIPITARQLPGLRSLTETSRQNPVSPLQQLAGSLGLRISRYSPVSETYKLAGKWMDSQKLERSKGSYPISKYQQLRYALEDGDIDRAKTEYDALLKTATSDKIKTGFKASVTHPFTGKKSTDEVFAKSLSGYDKQLYFQALKTRANILQSFSRLPTYRTSSLPPWSQTPPL